MTWLPPYRRNVNTVFQNYALFPHLTIFENVAFGLRRKGAKADDIKSRVTEMLRLVELPGFEGRKPTQISGGQAQRVALARALINKPAVLLLDEPLGALDLKLRKQMQLELKAIQHDLGVTFIHVTHDQEEAMTMADVIAVMNNGRIEQLGTPLELYERPRTRFVAGFLGVSNLLPAAVVAESTVRLDDGTILRAPVPPGAGRVAVGVRPEKIALSGAHDNKLAGVVAESAYVGVATQYIVETPTGRLTVYVQNARPGAQGAAPGDRVTLSWDPNSMFVVDATEGSP